MSVGFCNNQLSSLENIGQICIKSGKSGLPIPNKVAKSMVNLIPDDWFDAEPYMNGNTFDKDAYTESHRVIDICCNSGVLLEHFYYKFMQELNRAISNSDEREDYILQNLLYAFCLDSKLVRLLRMRLYWSSKCKGHIYQHNIVNDTGRDLVRARSVLDSMKFDVVVGNPPYNNDAYIDFVMKGHELARSYDLWITPAKFIAKNELMKLSNYFKDLKVYLEAQEIFDIRNLDGIAVYLLSKNKVVSCKFSNYIKKVSFFNSECNLNFQDIKTHNIFTNSLVKKLGCYKKLSDRLNLLQSPFGISKDVIGVSMKDDIHCYHLLAGLVGKEVDDRGYITEDMIHNSKDMVHKFKVCANTMLGNCFYDNNGTTLGFNATFIYKPDVVTPHPYLSLMAFDTEYEAICFNKYLNTKFIKFLFFTSLCSQNLTTVLNWRFIPDPGSFDRIFEDKPLDGYTPDENGEYIDSDGNKHCSLYVKYKLTQQEIDVVESVIRERK